MLLSKHTTCSVVEMLCLFVVRSSDERGLSSSRKQLYSILQVVRFDCFNLCLLLVYFEEVCKVSLSCKKAGVCSWNAPPWYREAFELSTYQSFIPVSFLHVSLHSEITMKGGVAKVKSEN